MDLHRATALLGLCALIACDQKQYTPEANGGSSRQEGDAALSSDASFGASDGAELAPDPDAGTVRPADAIAFDDFMKRQVVPQCRYILECLIPNDDLIFARAVLQTPERCAEYLGRLASTLRDTKDLGAAIERGVIAFDGARAAACLAAPFTCSPVPAAGQPCAGLFRGTLSEGDTCYRSEECAEGTFCDLADFSCPATCAAQKALGEACEQSEACQGDAFCDFSKEPSVCSAARTPEAPAGEGQPCGPLADGRVVGCSDALYCAATDRTQPGKCSAPIPLGEPCADIDVPCAGLGFCVGSTGNATCQEITIAREGDACDESADSAVRLCDPLANLTCVAGKCALAGNGRLDAPCLTGDLADGTTCNPSYYCDSDSQKCRPLEPEGSLCSSSAECAGSCDFESGQCRARTCSY